MVKLAFGGGAVDATAAAAQAADCVALRVQTFRDMPLEDSFDDVDVRYTAVFFVTLRSARKVPKFSSRARLTAHGDRIAPTSRIARFWLSCRSVILRRNTG